MLLFKCVKAGKDRSELGEQFQVYGIQMPLKILFRISTELIYF